MKREYCKHCDYPLVTCVCDSISHVTLPFRIVILQHPKEVKHPKNTAKLAKLVSPEIEIIVTDDEQNVIRFLNSVSITRTALLFPNEHSQCLEKVYPQLESKQNSLFDTLIFLDGSWKQAFSLYQSFHRLQCIPCFHFTAPPSQQYKIRKARTSHQLSTLEAIAHTLTMTSDVDVSHFYKLLNKLQDNWFNFAKNTNKKS